MKRFIVIASMLLLVFSVVGCDDTTTSSPSNNNGMSKPMGTVQGVVANCATRQPIEGAIVTLMASGSRTTKTNKLGYWYFKNVQAEEDGPPGGSTQLIPYYIEGPKDEGYFPMAGATGLDETVGSGLNDDETGQTNGLVTNFDFMVKGATIEGYVTDSDTGIGLDATVQVANCANNLFTDGLLNPCGSNASVVVNVTAAQTQSDAEENGWYQLTNLVPALVFNLNKLGAFADGYQYTTAAGADSSGTTNLVNLMWSKTARVDLRLNPLDNAMGLVAAYATVTYNVGDAAGSSTTRDSNLQILLDASGQVPTFGQDALVDMADATGLTFTLIFDQEIDKDHFFADTIQLGKVTAGVTTIVQKSMTFDFLNDDGYTVQLTANLNLFNGLYNDKYVLIASKTIQSMTHGQTIPGLPLNSGSLASFDVYDKSYIPENPTPAVYYQDTNKTDTGYIMDYNGLYTFNDYEYITVFGPVGGNEGNLTKAQNYTGLYERDIKTTLTLNYQQYRNQLDIYWTASKPIADISANTIWWKEVAASGDTFQNWKTVNSGGGGPTLEDNNIIAKDLTFGGNAFSDGVYPGGGTGNNLRYGNQLKIAVTATDTLGEENAIDPTKILTIRDERAPEITGFGGNVSGYMGGWITFNEPMRSGGSITNSTYCNSNLFTFVTAAMDPETLVTAPKMRYALAGTASETGLTKGNFAAAVMTRATDGANKYFVGQVCTFTFNNLDTANVTVNAINTAGATPTVTFSAAPTASNLCSLPFDLAVDNTRTFLRPAFAVANNATSASVINMGVNCQVAVGDTIIFMDTDNDLSGAPALTTTVKVVDVNSTTGNVTLDAAVPSTTQYEVAIFPGDILAVTATDEAGNGLHSDANDIGRNGDASALMPVGIGPATVIF